MKLNLSDKQFFRIALVISFVLHSFILFGFFQSRAELKQLEEKLKEKKRDMNFEVKPKKEFKPVNVKKIKPESSPPKYRSSEVKKTRDSAMPLVRENKPVLNHFQSLDKRPEKLKGIKVSRQVAVPVLQSSKIDSPAYVTYYQIVRDRIRQKAQEAYNSYEQVKSGNVYMTFILLANGELKQIRIIKDKSVPDAYLHRIGLESVDLASPFPAFPEELKYPELTFNIVITFQLAEEW